MPAAKAKKTETAVKKSTSAKPTTKVPRPGQKKGEAAKKRGGKARKELSDSDADAENEQEDSVEIETTEIEWTDDLTWKLINAIAENKDISQGLFPPPGANVSTKKGGGLRKTEHHWELCKILFSEHSDYKSAFEVAASDKGLKKGWQTKIKNRLGAKNNEYTKEMGATGAGIKRESDINMNEIKAEWPWYFDVRDLIGERPNLVPAGLGNGGTAMDTTILLNPTVDDAAEGVSDPTDGFEGVSSLGDDGGDIDVKSEDELELERSILEPKKRPAKFDESDPELEDQPSTSSKKQKTVTVKAETTPGKAKTTKPKSIMERYAEVAEQEELTAQKQADAMKAKSAIAVAKVKAQGEIELERERRKTEKEKLKAEIEMKRLQLDHELRMAQLRGAGHHNNTSMPTFSSYSPGGDNISQPTYSRASSTPFSFDGTHDTSSNGVGSLQIGDNNFMMSHDDEVCSWSLG
ncbi:hypothetical protein BJ138DRAFT_1120145 [Hygrophoropsis aurantiaca]|uniref:Uncharacterized protein n=1 Tax=Hygrophoropsis aurantiaca TaxID=72124 RepID=A0ACB7ZSF6_9AGAM|nr:hypothetical protein BJ138DRAFT_1120145 [Hygrophoropsis aurantiaca]